MPLRRVSLLRAHPWRPSPPCTTTQLASRPDPVAIMHVVHPRITMRVSLLSLTLFPASLALGSLRGLQVSKLPSSQQILPSC